MNNFVEQLLSERPKLHRLSEESAEEIRGYTGYVLEPGPMDWGVPENVMRYLAENIRETDQTIETGSGLTTVLMAGLAEHHTCITNDAISAELIYGYMEGIGLPQSKLTMIVESSDFALPKLPSEQKFDFAFIDGGHGYPIPTLDRHYIDLHLRIGGQIGFDNTEIPAVHDHCAFLQRNGTYRLVESLTFPAWGNYGANFWVKLNDQSRGDLAQKDGQRRVTRHNFVDSMKTTIANVTGRRFGAWPWS